MLKRLSFLLLSIFFIGNIYAITTTFTPTRTYTYTVTPTPTVTITATRTPLPNVYYYTDKAMESGSFIMSASDGTYTVDLSNISTWLDTGYGIKLNRNIILANTTIVAYKHPVSFTAQIIDRTTLIPIDCSSNTCIVFYSIFRKYP